MTKELGKLTVATIKAQLDTYKVDYSDIRLKADLLARLQEYVESHTDEPKEKKTTKRTRSNSSSTSCDKKVDKKDDNNKRTSKDSANVTAAVGPPKKKSKKVSSTPTTITATTNNTDTNTSFIKKMATDLEKSSYNAKQLSDFEMSQALEKVLWPEYEKQCRETTTTTSSSAVLVHMILLMVTEKFRLGVPALEVMTDKSVFSRFVVELINVFKHDKSLHIKQDIVYFFIKCLTLFENAIVRTTLLPMYSYDVWKCLTPTSLQHVLSMSKRYKSAWSKLEKKYAKLDATELSHRLILASFISDLIDEYFVNLHQLNLSQSNENKKRLAFCQRVLEFLIDIESQLPTRRYTHVLLMDKAVVVRSFSITMAQSSTLYRLVDMLDFYMGFEIDNVTGAAMTDSEMMAQHYEKISQMQKQCFISTNKLKHVALASTRMIDNRASMEKLMNTLDTTVIKSLMSKLGLGYDESWERDLLIKIMTHHYSKRPSQLETTNLTPLYPSEHMLFDADMSFFNNNKIKGKCCNSLALPKLKVMFLTLFDYLLVNFNLFRLESAYEIGEDIKSAVRRMPVTVDGHGQTHFNGWARMALTIDEYSIVEIGKPLLGETRPSVVRADITYSVKRCRDDIKHDWDSLRPHDVLFLTSIQGGASDTNFNDNMMNTVNGSHIQMVRGCEVEGFVGPDGKLLVDDRGLQNNIELKGHVRTIRVFLDTNQYALDQQQQQQQTFNLLVRRRPQENNFRAILHTIRNMMNSTHTVVPEWLHDLFLGYGAPDSAHYTNLIDPASPFTFNMNDTFLNLNHIVESFPNYTVYCADGNDDGEMTGPFTLTFPALDEEKKKTILVDQIKPLNNGPFQAVKGAKVNTIKFTPVQVDAIKSALFPGLTQVVGPPGTGKTDVAVQIISNWYHNYPNEKILLVTHSNQALNQLFEKIMALDIDERHLLRLGSGEADMDTEKVFNKYGRVNYILERRLQLLQKVESLAKSLHLHNNNRSYTCETAGYFYLYNIVSKWEAFLAQVKKNDNTVSTLFPFTVFFEEGLPSGQDLFKKQSYEQDMEIAEGCFRYLTNMFTELEEYHAFEILRHGQDRINYLLVKEARIVAMTCTHAALKRDSLIKLKFHYDNILMEEAAQILEIETFIPMMCQEDVGFSSRLKRVVLIGDHHQLPPVVKNTALLKICNMEQSLFTRFIRLNVPRIMLDRQGRARAEIAALYKWRYPSLGDLPHVTQDKRYQQANPGFVHTYQFINVEDFNGQGESEPQPYYYQNLGEAEYVAWTYMYMRALGYARESISIITTYNGQSALIRDVIQARCGEMYGMPLKISTVDKFQGQQNDIILLSLVRTKAVGFIRDVRRLVVALSRARFGLYIFGREALFKNVKELQKVMTLLVNNNHSTSCLALECLPSNARLVNHVVPPSNICLVRDVAHMASIVNQRSEAQLIKST